VFYSCGYLQRKAAEVAVRAQKLAAIQRTKRVGAVFDDGRAEAETKEAALLYKKGSRQPGVDPINI